jgi:hypothetical protein
MVVVGIQIQPESVGFGFLIAAGQLPYDPRRLAVVHPSADIQRVVVVRHAQFGPFGGGLAFVRVALGERGGGRRPQPDLVVEAAVDHHARVRPHHLHHRYGCVARGLLAACGRRGKGGGKKRDPDRAKHG